MKHQLLKITPLHGAWPCRVPLESLPHHLAWHLGEDQRVSSYLNYLKKEHSILAVVGVALPDACAQETNAPDVSE